MTRARRGAAPTSRWVRERSQPCRRPKQATLIGDAVAAAALLVLVGLASSFSTTMLMVGVPIVVTSGLLIRGPLQTLQPHLRRRAGHLTMLAGLVALPLSVLLPDRAHGVATYALATLIALLGHRVVMARVVKHRRRRGQWLEPTVVLGAGEVGQQLVHALQVRPDMGVRPIGYVDHLQESPNGLPVLGSPDDLVAILADTGATTLVLAFGPVREPDLIPVLRQTLAVNARLRVLALPRLYELGTLHGGEIEYLHGYPLMELTPAPTIRPGWRAKRIMDVVLATGLVVATAPLLGAAALAVRLSSPGPIIFRQERVGLRGQRFEVLKLRSMEVNAESDTHWNAVGDPRVTPVGELLRRTHLDELPQLLNVLRGDMSLVGPRPERPHFAEGFEEHVRGYGHRHRVPAGMTGLAQVHGLKGDTSITERARFDNRYIEDWSLWGDLRILARTLASVLGRDELPVEPAPLRPALASSGGEPDMADGYPGTGASREGQLPGF